MLAKLVVFFFVVREWMRVAAIGFVEANGKVGVKFLKSGSFSRVGSDFYSVLAVLLVCGWLFLWVNAGAECFYEKSTVVVKFFFWRW